MSRRMRSSLTIAAITHAKLCAAHAEQASKIVAWHGRGACEPMVETDMAAFSELVRTGVRRALVVTFRSRPITVDLSAHITAVDMQTKGPDTAYPSVRRLAPPTRAARSPCQEWTSSSCREGAANARQFELGRTSTRSAIFSIPSD